MKRSKQTKLCFLFTCTVLEGFFQLTSLRKRFVWMIPLRAHLKGEIPSLGKPRFPLSMKKTYFRSSNLGNELLYLGKFCTQTVIFLLSAHGV